MLFKPEYVTEFMTMNHSSRKTAKKQNPPKPKQKKTLAEIEAEKARLAELHEQNKARRAALAELQAMKESAAKERKALMRHERAEKAKEYIRNVFKDVLDEELECGNPNCYSTAIVEDGEDLYVVRNELREVGWGYFGQWLCPECAKIEHLRRKRAAVARKIAREAGDDNL